MSQKPTYEQLEQRFKELEADAVRHRQAERNLQESEARFRALMDNIPAVVATGTATKIINTGDRISCNGDDGAVKIIKRR